MSKFQVIYADPCWEYNTWTDKASRSASVHYPTAGTDWIASLPVEAVAADNCALFLWATYPNLPDALRVIEAWGFTYKTCGFTWIKTTSENKARMGLGYWTRSNAEVCLLATRGRPQRLDKGVEQVVACPLGRHSEKPRELYGRIERLVDGPYLELFARPLGGLFPTQDGWTQLGNEMDGQDIGDALRALALETELVAA